MVRDFVDPDHPRFTLLLDTRPHVLSSGATYARPSVAAIACAARTRAMLPRGLAPYRTSTWSRVYSASRTAYDRIPGSSRAVRTSWIAARRIGIRRWTFGSLAPRQRDLREAALPCMHDLFQVTQETSS